MKSSICFQSLTWRTALVVLFCSIVGSPQAIWAKGYEKHPKAIDLAKQLEAEHGIAQERTLSLLAQAKKRPNVIRAIKPPKKKSPRRDWDKYRAQFVEPLRINRGVDFWKKHEDTLNLAQNEFGIPASVIVAIIGVETLYGQHIGKDRVLDALATLAFDYPSGQRDRSPFFLKELGAFIVLTETTQLNATSVKGSFAGAVGLGQFMPSSWQNFAVDGDKDGQIDLFNSKKDAIFSVANFLKEHGWEKGAAMLVPIRIKHRKHFKTLLEPDIIPTFTAQQLIDKGVQLKRKTLEGEKLALIELVRGQKKPTYVVGGQNFYVVTRYNRSSFYATAVLELAEALEARRSMQAKN